MSLAIASSAAQPATPEVFDLWAAVYDQQLNPFLSLEQRIVSALLPDLHKRDVLDAGCGTGRWLKRLAEQEPHTLVGVDSSPEMLTRASYIVADLHCASCTALPLADSSIDVALSSFVLSYVEDLDAFVKELARVTRPDATVLLSDLHPDTTRRLTWHRSFPSASGEIEIVTHDWYIEELVPLFEAHGFTLTARIEAPFAAPEQEVFAQAGKIAAFTELQEYPAICVLSFTRSKAADKPGLALRKTRAALTPQDAVATSITITGNRLARLAAPSDAAAEIDLTGYLVLPGLVNAHDHLEFGLFPRLGHGPYANAKQWADDIHARDSELIALHRSIPHDTRIFWGALRNLLCGVTTVCHHNPLTPEMFAPDFPVTVLEHFSWAHSVAIEPELAKKFYPADKPFIVHAAEGTDAASAAELAQLDQLHLIHENTILVHGLALTREDTALLNQRGAALIACPSSNQFLFRHTPAPELLNSVERLAIGSDSPLTAAGDLLDELRFTQTHLHLDGELLYRAVTTAPAQMLRLRHHEGRVVPGAGADLIAIKDRRRSPSGALGCIISADVELVVRQGRVFLASEELYRRLPEHVRRGLEPALIDREPRWLRAPLERLFQEASPLLRDGALHLAGKEVRYGHGDTDKLPV